jgi:salicylate hydroxylase
MLPNAGQGAAQAFEDAYTLARWLQAEHEPVEAFRNFRRVRIPRVHGVQRLSFAYARLKHMRDLEAQKTIIAKAQEGRANNSEWIWAYDPVDGWDKMPVVPLIE